MKLLTATSRAQGQRDSDFTWCVEGELVAPAMICDRDKQEGPDGGCGCGRSFTGLNSGKSTTTALVSDLDLSPADIALALKAHLEQGGWGTEQIAEETQAMMNAAAGHPVGTVVEIRMGAIGER